MATVEENLLKIKTINAQMAELENFRLTIVKQTDGRTGVMWDSNKASMMMLSSTISESTISGMVSNVNETITKAFKDEIATLKTQAKAILNELLTTMNGA